MADGSIDKDEFMVFLYRLFYKYKNEEITLYMDNLSFHRAILVRDFVEDRDSQILFAPAYSSEYNLSEKLFTAIDSSFLACWAFVGFR